MAKKKTQRPVASKNTRETESEKNTFATWQKAVVAYLAEDEEHAERLRELISTDENHLKIKELFDRGETVEDAAHWLQGI